MKAIEIPNKKLLKDIKRRERVKFSEIEQEYMRCFDAMVLYILHDQLGLGAKRLKRFYRQFGKVHADFIEKYQSEDWREDEWIVRRELKSIGVDLEAWEKEGAE